jgi:hypothetical protein
MLMDVAFWWAFVMPVVFVVCFLSWRSGRRWTGRAALWGVIIGFAGFVVGELWAFLRAPDANQGFLIGIFFTGPIAFAATSTALLVVGAFKLRRKSRRTAT